jgi:spore coat-associated protein N
VSGIPRARTGRVLLAALLLVAGYAARDGVLAARALFDVAKPVGSNSFGAGTVDIATSPTTALLTLTAMGPGDTLTAPITVTNNGSLQLRYAITSTTTENSLAGQLDLYIKSGVTTCTTAGFGASGSTLYNDTSHLGSTTGVNVVGDPNQGSQAGDRTLNAGANETLCLQVSMPATIPNSYHSITGTVTLTFQAEQTTNN